MSTAFPDRPTRILRASHTECERVWGRFYRRLIESAVVVERTQGDVIYELRFRREVDTERLYISACRWLERETRERLFTTSY